MKLLLLFHRLPYPPNKGEKIRYFHFLRGLAARHRVFVGCVAEPSDSGGDIEAVRALAADTKVVVVGPNGRRAAYARGLLTGKALSLAPFESAELQAWVKSGKLKVQEDIIGGLENTPAALIGLLAGENRGKRMVKV